MELRGKNSLKLLVTKQERDGTRKIQKLGIKSENAALDSRTQSQGYFDAKEEYCTVHAHRGQSRSEIRHMTNRCLHLLPLAAAAQPPLRSASITGKGSPGMTIGI